MDYKLIGLIFLIGHGLIQHVWSQSNDKSNANRTCSNPLCSCCLEIAPCEMTDGACVGLCKEGFHGGKCLNNCPDNCVTCTDVYNPTNSPSLWQTAFCTKCKPGYYSTRDFYQCQFTCPPGCGVCTSDTECTSCNNRYYKSGKECLVCPSGCDSCTSSSQCTHCQDGWYVFGRICSPCPNGCQEMCDKESGNCSLCKQFFAGDKCETCVNGRYNTTNNCDLLCQPPCENCIDIDECTSCANGYAVNGTTCQLCKLGCAQCLSPDTCLQCSNGYYMSNNSVDCEPCSTGCANECDSHSAICSCKVGFTGEKCDICAQNVQNYPTCSKCAAGYHGIYCNMDCPVNCNNKTCDRNSGACIYGCTGYFTGDYCVACINGWYGTTCNNKCPDNCFGGVCDRDTGYCQKCKETFFGNKCHDCVTGKYGNDCDLACPTNCENATCDRVFGHCNSCISGFSGDRCCLEGLSCQSCLSDFECSVCFPGKHGSFCDEDCPENCNGKLCDMDNGTCNACINGFKGDFCTISFTGLSSGDVSEAAIAGTLTSLIIIIVIVLIVFFKRRLRSNASTGDLLSDSANELENISESSPYNIIGDLDPSASAASLKKVYAKPIHKKENTKTKENLNLSRKPDGAANPPNPPKTTKTATSTKPTKDHEYFGNENENDYYNSEACLRKVVHVSDLSAYVYNKDMESFKTEFENLHMCLKKYTKAALQEANIDEKLYNEMLPSGKTDVALSGQGTDFINACYIQGYRKGRMYIALLDSVAKVTEGYNPFWRMVWQEKTEKIVMFIKQGGGERQQYWPDKSVTLAYGDVKVTCHSEEVYAEYTVRSFTVSKRKEQRILHHIEYTAWPEKGVPDDVASLVEFRNKVNSTETNLRGPIIVHCCADVGLTGIYMALDILTLKGKRKGAVDVFKSVKKIQRRNCVLQTVEQYEYLHRALVHTLTLESEAIPADSFNAYTESLSDDKFDRLSRCLEKVKDHEKEAITRNKAYTSYNRPGADIPGDISRPKLHNCRTVEDNDYINAIFVNSFKQKNQFILAQTPLPNTVDDFLTLALQENCCCVVSIDATDLNDDSIGTYIPADNQTLSTEAYDVKSTKLDSNQSYSHRSLSINSKSLSSPTNVQHFVCANWSDRDKTPKSPSEFLTLVKHTQRVADESSQFSPVIVHCRTGSGRSALLCVVMSLLQKIEVEHEVSVINTIRQFRARRSMAIPNKEQFKFCHQCVSVYLQSFENYSNFT